MALYDDLRKIELLEVSEDALDEIEKTLESLIGNVYYTIWAGAFKNTFHIDISYNPATVLVEYRSLGKHNMLRFVTEITSEEKSKSYKILFTNADIQSVFIK